jgi:hypothetical protein
MGFFGPSKADIWQQLSDSIGATFTAGGFLKGDRVDASVGEWIVTLDTYTMSDGKTSVTMTRMRAPYSNPTGMRFSVSRANLFTPIGKALGFQHIAVGDPMFDRDFVVTGNYESTIINLLRDPEIRDLLERQPDVHFDVRDSEGWFGPRFPENSDELYFTTYGVVTNLDRLKALFDLFARVLHRLTEIGAAAAGDPGVSL